MEKISNNTSVNHQMQNFSQNNKVNIRPVLNCAKNANKNYDTIELSNKKKKIDTIFKIIAGTISIGAIILAITKNKLKSITQSTEIIAKQVANVSNSTPKTNIEHQLEKLAQRLSDEYESFSAESKKITTEFIFGADENTRSLYEGLATR